MKKAVAAFGDMLNNDEYLFNQTWQILTEQADIEQISQEISDKDSEVNTQERAIRRWLVEHLSINPKHDTSGCLALMSMVKDAERIGDYAKNMLEVGVMFKGTIKDIKYFPRLATIEQNIADHFPTLVKAFLKSDATLAESILQHYSSIKAECNRILEDVFMEQLPSQEAIATALLARYLKRINSHISNIASGIIYPLDEIDFVRGDILE
jgi:phosphate uptake regulator